MPETLVMMTAIPTVIGAMLVVQLCKKKKTKAQEFLKILIKN